MQKIILERNGFYNELSEEKQKEYFYTKEKSSLPAIDNIYYSIFIEDDIKSENPKLLNFFAFLDGLKIKVREEHKPQQVTDLLYIDRGSHDLYHYKLSNPDLYDIFLASSIPNRDTPRIHIQIRSMGLWTQGAVQTLNDSYKAICELFEGYDVVLRRCQENRIDYAYHTNIIHNPEKSFKDDKLRTSTKTTMRHHIQAGRIISKKDETLYKKDYLALGNRKSNNVFIRIYNKSLEVIDNGYKAFFFELWYQNKLISYYDKFCLEKSYEKKDWNYIHQAKLMFYLEHGLDDKRKNSYKEALEDKTTTHEDYQRLAAYLPDITTIVNIEFETKRKFYYYSDDFIDVMLKTQQDDINPVLTRIYKIIDNRSIFLEYLTSKTFSFQKDGEYLNWWQRLRNTKLEGIKLDAKLLRSYNFECNDNMARIKLINSLATLSVHKNLLDKDFEENIADLMSDINDNDKNRYYQAQDKQYQRLKNRIKKADEK